MNWCRRLLKMTTVEYGTVRGDYLEHDDSQIAVIAGAILKDEHIDLEFGFLHPAAERPFQLIRFELLPGGISITCASSQSAYGSGVMKL